MRHAFDAGPGTRLCRIARNHERAAVAEIAERASDLGPMIGSQPQRGMLQNDAVDVLLGGVAARVAAVPYIVVDENEVRVDGAALGIQPASSGE